MKTAVLYLRVSTVGQVETDYDPEGISIPAQRAACRRKAEQMGVMVVDEYVEPGRSATTIDKRPMFQQMLERIKAERDVDYVIVYNLSRLNRNRVDDARVLMTMRTLKVTLISAQENIDETPAGHLMHGILAAFNEYRSNADGADIRYKMGQKAKTGGTIGRAKLGYLNVRDRSAGREVRTIQVDPERAPYVKLAFELYATGDYSVERLAQTLTDRGLRMRAFGRQLAGPISTSQLAAVLRDRYYLGIVEYQGEEYPGRHEPLVPPELFARVQTELDSHNAAGERQRKHSHYLKGTLWCGRCHDQDRESRMILQRAIGRHGGEYWYFFCIRRQDHLCDAPYVQVEDLEAAVLRHYGTIVLPPGFTERVRAKLDEALADQERGARLLRRQRTSALQALDTKEENLLDLAADPAVPKDKIRQRLRAIAEERERLTEELASSETSLAAGAAVLRSALGLLDDLEEMYRQAGSVTRRLINQAFFTHLYVDGPEVTEERLAEPFDEILYFRRFSRWSYERRRGLERANGAPKDAARRLTTSAGLLATALAGRGSSKAAMVELRGFEPLTPSMRTRCATGLRYSPKPGRGYRTGGGVRKRLSR